MKIVKHDNIQKWRETVSYKLQNTQQSYHYPFVSIIEVKNIIDVNYHMKDIDVCNHYVSISCFC